jgi:hypothetical protein
MVAAPTLTVLFNPFCLFTAAQVLALKGTVLLLLTLLIRARIQIVAGSALGIFLLLQALVFLSISGGLLLAAGGAALVAMQQRRSAQA